MKKPSTGMAEGFFMRMRSASRDAMFVQPEIEVFDEIDDPRSDPDVRWAVAGDAPLLQSPGRQARVPGCFSGGKRSRGRVGHRLRCAIAG